MDDQKEVYPSRIDESRLSIDTYLEKALKTVKDWRCLDPHIIHRVPLKGLVSAQLEILIAFLNHNELYSFEGVVDLLKACHNKV